MVRPVIETSVFESSGQLHLVKEWLRHNVDKELAPEASELIAQVEALGAARLAKGGSATGRDAATATTLSHDVVAHLISSLAKELGSTMPTALRNTLVDWLTLIEGHADLRDDQRARVFAAQIIFFTLRFLQWCTDRASLSGEMSAYLFERGAKLPRENVLQKHYIAMLSGWMGRWVWKSPGSLEGAVMSCSALAPIGSSWRSSVSKMTRHQTRSFAPMARKPTSIRTQVGGSESFWCSI